jgi:hypothetical protein
VVVWAAATTHPLAPQQALGHEVASQATHEPEEQIIPVPHVMPSLMLLTGMQTGPLEHVCVPLLHLLLDGVHVEFAAHATQLPSPSHTPLGTLAVVQAVPAVAALP